MKPKVLIVILIILVVLLAVFIGIGSTRKDAPLGEGFPSWIEALSGLLVREEPLKAGDIDVATPPRSRDLVEKGELRLESGGSFTLLIGRSEASVRILPLRLLQGGPVSIEFDPRDENRLTARETLNAGDKDMVLRIFEEGGTLKIRCTDTGSAAGCILKVAEKERTKPG